MTPRSCLRWKPTSKIFKTVGLRWVPTGKIFTSSTTKVDSEPTNGSDEDITNQYECEQTLDVSAAMTSDHNSSELGIHDHSNEPSSSKLVPKVVPPADKTATSRQELELLFHHHITMLRIKKKCMDKGSKERSPPHNLGRNRVNTYAVRITMLIADIEDDIMDPVMQCTTLPSHSGFSQKKLVSFVTEIHTTSIDFLTPKHPSDTYILTMKMEILLEPASDKLLVGYIKMENSIKIQESRKAQELKTKELPHKLEYKIIPSKDINLIKEDCFSKLFKMIKFEHVGQDTRSQGGKDDQDGRIKI
ncbi:hypothetical protein Tco_1072094 [Tanacetum coccineum]